MNNPFAKALKDFDFSFSVELPVNCVPYQFVILEPLCGGTSCLL